MEKLGILDERMLKKISDQETSATKLMLESTNIHEEILAELHGKADNKNGERLNISSYAKIDLFSRPEEENNDRIKTKAATVVLSHETIRNKEGGPSCKRDKFKPSYWRKWHSECQLLRNISAQVDAGMDPLREKIKQEQRQSMRRSKTNSLKSIDRGDYRVKEPIGQSFAGQNRFQLQRQQMYDTTGTKSTISGVKGMRGGSGNGGEWGIVDEEQLRMLHKCTIQGQKEEIKRVYEKEQKLLLHTNSHSKSLLKPLAASLESAIIHGGSFERANLHKIDPAMLTTKNCDIPPLPSFIDKMKANEFAGVFNAAPRFPSASAQSSSSGAIAMSADDSLSATKAMKKTGISFPQAQRVTGDISAGNCAPGPGEYKVKRLFDGDNKNKKDLEEIFKEFEEAPKGLSGLPENEYRSLTYFGRGCDMQEHILYGMCQSGSCCSRSLSESAMLRGNDLLHLCGTERVKKFGKNIHRLKSSGDLLIGEALVSALPEAVYRVSALCAAVYRDDVRTIVEIAMNVKVTDPNLRQENTGFTAMHVACLQGSVRCARVLLDCFGEKIDLQVQDFQGDTALHIACRRGDKDLVALLCDVEFCQPEGIKNQLGRTAMDEAMDNTNHAVYQYLAACEERNRLIKCMASSMR